MAKDTTLTHAWDGISQGVWLAPSGTAAPTDPTTAWPVAWKEVGWISDNGVTEHRANQETKKYAWQGNSLIRTLRSQYEFTFTFQSLEKNRVTDSVLNPNSTIVTTTTINTITDVVPASQLLQAIGLDFQNGAIKERWVIPIAEIQATGDPQYVGNDLAAYDFTVTAYPSSIGVWRFRINNDATFVGP